MLRIQKLKNDQAISPVIGTILMIAATVIIAGAVYAAVNLYSGKQTKTSVDASWKAQALDSDGDGLDDTVKVTYLTGPIDASTAGISMSAQQTNGTAMSSGATSHKTAGLWNPGDYATYTLQYGPGPSGVATVIVGVTQSGNTMLDQTLTLRD